MLTTGVEIVCGVPGSGKSYHMVTEILRVIRHEGRPVWTNLPIRIKTMRAYLQVLHGRDTHLARYIRPLTQQHFARFCARLQRINQVAAAILESDGVDMAELEDEADFRVQEARRRAIDQIDGEKPPRMSGPGADWIPPGAVVALDELHLWYPTRSQQHESPDILAYTSMHRHLLHRVYVISQRAMNVTLSLRAMAQFYTFCLNRSYLPFYFRVRLPFKAFSVGTYNAVDIKDGKVSQGARMLKHRLHIPALDEWVVYRLYDSHTHAGDLRALMRQVDEVRDRLEGRHNKNGGLER